MSQVKINTYESFFKGYSILTQGADISDALVEAVIKSFSEHTGSTELPLAIMDVEFRDADPIILLEKKIKQSIEKLDDRDGEGHIWWNKFLNLLRECEMDYTDIPKINTQ